MYTTKQIKELEHLAITEAKISEWELMQRAGAEALELVKLKYQDAENIAVLCGSGNNAGDGYVFAAKAKAAGKTVDCFYLSDPKSLKQPALAAYELAVRNGVNIQAFTDELPLNDYDLLIDALLGTGFKGQLRPDFFQAISALNASHRPAIAGKPPAIGASRRRSHPPEPSPPSLHAARR